MEMPLRHREWEGEEQSVSECVSQPALDPTGSVALTAACQSLGRGSFMCAWAGCYPEMVVYLCSCVLSGVTCTYLVCEGCVTVLILCVYVPVLPMYISLRRLCVCACVPSALNGCLSIVYFCLDYLGGICLL